MADGSSAELSQPHQNPLTRKLKKILNTRLDNDKVINFFLRFNIKIHNKIAMYSMCMATKVTKDFLQVEQI